MRGKFNVKVFEKSRGVGGRMSTKKNLLYSRSWSTIFKIKKKFDASLNFFRTI